MDQVEVDAGTKTNFDDPDVAWATVIVAVEPAQVIGSLPAQSGPVEFAVSVDGHARYDSIEALKSMGEVVIFLDSTSFDDLPDVPRIAMGGTLIAAVSGDKMTFPILEKAGDDYFVEGFSSFDDLVEQSSADRPVIKIDFQADVSQ